MMALFDDEKIQKAYGKEKYDEGIAEGEARGAGLMSKLAVLLAKDGKIDDIARAGTDEEYMNVLLKKYKLA